MNAHFQEPDLLDRMETIIDSLRRHKAEIMEALALSNFSHSFEHVVMRIMQGDLDMYVLPNSVIIAEVHNSPNFDTYNVYIAAGDLDEIIGFEDQLIYEAKLRKCKAVSATGRRGWEKALGKIGWRHSLTTMTKELPDG